MKLSDIDALQSPQARALLDAHHMDDPHEFALRHARRRHLPIAAIAEQIACRTKAAAKLPALSKSDFLYSPVALEQCSREATAHFKAGFMAGGSVVDITGGLGIDTLAFARSFERVVYCEKDEVLAKLFAANVQSMRVDNIDIRHADGVTYLRNVADDAFDWIFGDPSRRNGTARKVGLTACEPDVTQMEVLMLAKARRVCIKASPALDIVMAQRQLAHLQRCLVVSVNGKCKEVLLLSGRAQPNGSRVAVESVLLNETGQVRYRIDGAYEPSARCRDITMRRKYLYEPDAAIIKAHLSSKVCAAYGLSFINATTDYATGDKLLQDFPGRTFEIVASLPWRKKAVRAYLHAHHIEKANISRRDFPHAPEEVRKMLPAKEGGDEFLFFTRDSNRDPIMIHARKPH
ncbi:MAG: hypothetical protein GF398_14570 [Chitinivibrionales bacterium]|nr:hypothetical protein [Chitinivibrionales bacterium]